MGGCRRARACMRHGCSMGITALLERSWPEMERYMDFIETGNPEYLRRNQLGNNYGDWLAPDQQYAATI